MALSEQAKAARKAASAARRKAQHAAYKAAHREAINERERARRAAIKADPPPATRACEWCGAGFTMAGKSATRNAGRFCSHACGFDYQRTTRALDKAVRDVARQAAAAVRALVRAECQALQRIASYKERPRVFIHACRQCGEPMRVTRNAGLHRIVCDDCKADNQWHLGQTHRAKRRAVTLGADAESINPILVFTLAFWRCKACGKETPRSLRGTTHADAPELDHVIALANGGTHTWGNVQLLCRACNQAKGAS